LSLKDDEAARLMKQLDAARNQLAEFAKSLSCKDEEIACVNTALREKLAEQGQILAIKDAEIAQKQREIVLANTVLQEQEGMIFESNVLVQEKTMEVDTLKGQIRDLTHRTDHAWSEVDFSKQQLQEALEQVRAKCVEVSAKEEAEKMVRGDLNACQQQLHDAQALLELMSEQSLSQQHDLDTLRAEVAQLQGSLSSARVDADGRFAEQAKSLAMKDADIAEKQREIDSLILDYDGRLRSHIASLEAKDEKIKVKDAELMDKQRTIDGLTSRLEEDAMQLATKDEELGARERELSEARLEVDERGAAMERAEAAWSAQRAALSSAREDAQRGSLEAGNRLSHIESELQQAQVLCVISLNLIFSRLIRSHLNFLSTFQELVHELQRKQGEQNEELEAMRGQCQRAQAEVESRGIELKSCIARLDCTQETFLNLNTQHGQVLEELEDLKVQREQVFNSRVKGLLSLTLHGHYSASDCRSCARWWQMLKEIVKNETQLEIYKCKVQEAEKSGARVSQDMEDSQRQRQAFELRLEELMGQVYVFDVNVHADVCDRARKHPRSFELFSSINTCTCGHATGGRCTFGTRRDENTQGGKRRPNSYAGAQLRGALRPVFGGSGGGAGVQGAARCRTQGAGVCCRQLACVRSLLSIFSAQCSSRTGTRTNTYVMQC
jgi:hypothetical protein